MHEAFGCHAHILQATVTLSAISRRRTDDLELLNMGLSACGPSQHGPRVISPRSRTRCAEYLCFLPLSHSGPRPRRCSRVEKDSESSTMRHASRIKGTGECSWRGRGLKGSTGAWDLGPPLTESSSLSAKPLTRQAGTDGILYLGCNAADCGCNY